MTSNSKKVLLNTAKYIYHAFNFRNTLFNLNVPNYLYFTFCISAL